MNLLIMRHGPAEDVAPTGRDADRRLTATGRDRVRQVATALPWEPAEGFRLYSSPLRRAVETAEIVELAVRSRGNRTEIEFRDDLLPDEDATPFIRHLALEGVLSAMVVGHEPQLTDLVGRLLGTRAPMPMQKAMVVALALAPGAPVATLQFVLDPKTLVMSRP